MDIYSRFGNIEDNLIENNSDNCCLLCNKQGIEVSYDTVLSLSNDFIKTTLKYDKYYLCINKSCEVAYYSKDKKIMCDEVITPIWLKDKKSKYIVCYCRNITLEDIIETIKSIKEDEITIDKVVKHLNKENIRTNCLFKMPTGESCNQLFLNAIEYARKKVSKNRTM